MESKFNKIVWTINGIGILLILLISSGYFVVNYINKLSKPEYERGLLVTADNEKLRNIKLNFQHIMYQTPEKIDTTDVYLTRVTILDKKLPDEIKKAFSEAAQISYDLVGATINVIFFTADRSEVYKLLPHNAYIDDISFPTSSTYSYYDRDDNTKTQPFILYKIAMNDNNGDKRINDKDNMSYYISDLRGKNLHRITPDTLKLDNYWFTRDYKEIYFESIKEVKTEEDLPYPLKERKLYYYNVASKKFGSFDKIQNLLQGIQKDFIKNN